MHFTEISQVICLGRGEKIKVTSSKFSQVSSVGGGERVPLVQSWEG